MNKPDAFKILALFCIAFITAAFCPNENTVAYYKVDSYPLFSYKNINNSGEACKAYFAEHVIMPGKKKNEWIFGKIYIQFIVEKDGSLSQVKLLHGVDRVLNRLALKAVKKMPRWTPGVRDGKIVRTWYAVAIKWSYPDGETDVATSKEKQKTVLAKAKETRK